MRIRARAGLCACACGAFLKKGSFSSQERADLAAKLGFDAAYLNSAPYFNLPAVCFANQAKFHPRKYLRSLVVKIPGSGSHVFEKSGASEFDPKSAALRLTAPGSVSIAW